MNAPAASSPLDRPAQFLKGVGPRRADALGRLGVHTARDLLFHVPRRYEDASTVSRIGSAEPGMDVTVIGEVRSKGVLPTRSGLRIFQAVLFDDSGLIECSWPGQPFLDRTIQKGDVLLVTGPVRFFHGRQLQPREYVVLGRAGEGVGQGGKVLPLYPATEGLSQKVIRGILDDNLDRLLPLVHTEDAVPPALLKRLGLPSLMQAVQLVHRPATLAEAESGRRRLSFDELFFLQLMYARAQQRAQARRPGIAFARNDRIIAPLYRALPFPLTAAQTRAIAAIFADMTSPRRMNRLLQGDVGAGKTIVALFAMALAVESGYQAALMAPTEILAEQHARGLAGYAGPLGLSVVLLTGSLGAAERRAALERIADGSAHIVIGTHALIQESVRFHSLGLAVVDEQHRFGVKQRLALAAQGDAPDVLVMSATPIPRSLAMTLYGDLELTILDELPPHRRPVRTVLRPESARERVYQFVREQVAAGRQAFIVYPLVAESEKVDLRAATAEYERLSIDVFPDLALGLVHGQLAAEEKDVVMQRFVSGAVQILVATSVIEVGIDVPNATVLVVEHAERFGLSQLHQLRGRVGRGAEQSFCILVAGAETERLAILTGSADGFEIARADLQLRGMGDFFGARQHGLPEFRFFDPIRDEDLLTEARAAARATATSDPELRQPEHARLRTSLEHRFADRERLYEVG
ncbi:MAG TPA: ATP-dependent DNA helicase RecG [Longimicrobiales bacterium]|nr:ATP-dependent DNA helicase RecG [Longimicrobiales bacterium]